MHISSNKTLPDALGCATSIAKLAVGIARIVKYTHRHPLNRMLHCVGLALYSWITLILLGTLSGGGQTNWILVSLIWSLAICIMVMGHAIEGNVRTMTPVLVGRLLIRAIRQASRNSRRNQIKPF